ncbi:hypothetical protein LTR64_003944 [Lithohypha guttulata]|uniref:uncharacterized protein n=1 Tax=Lithohypha guttulata TaxID=1690604 RepID=UPI002DE1C70F|nr:hypothetical protein LTR51_006982 [Lithohypha guttulata]
MANPHQYSYRPSVGRNVTRKWAEARQVDYGGDDWGQDDGYEPEPVQQSLAQGGRSFTNPAINTGSRLSFDHAPEQRNFSAGANPPSYDFPPAQSTSAGHFYPQQPYNQHMMRQDPPARTSIDSARRPDSRSSNHSSRFPPRKSSLGQQDFAEYNPPQPYTDSMPPPPPAPESTTKPLPFIRPADIYKRLDEEREKERRPQETSRPSMDSIRRGAREDPPPLPNQALSTRTMPPFSDTTTKRQNELETEMPPKIPAQAKAPNTNVLRAPSRSLTSSTYADSPDIDSATAGEPRIPSRDITNRDPQPISSTLPQISRVSTFDSDFFQSGSPSALRQHDSNQDPTFQSLSENTSSNRLQQQPSQGFSSTANDASNSPATTDASLLRSNTTSTSQISPIMDDFNNQYFDRTPNRPAAPISDAESTTIPYAGAQEDVFYPPKRPASNRTNSPSPARRPQSAKAPPVPEPQSAVASAGDVLDRVAVMEAQVARPGPAVVTHPQPLASKTDHANPMLPKQDSSVSVASDKQRTASEEWEDWSAARKEAHARHGIQDSNPATPGLPSSEMSSPDLMPSGLNRGSARSSEYTQNPPSDKVGLSSHRPQMLRDESFRPQLPGGWMSTSSVQKAAPAPLEPSKPTHPRPLFGTAHRNDSEASLPTARAPQDNDWKSQYTSGVQAQAFAAVANAGSALAGIFSGPSLTSTAHTDSDVSSINESEGPTGTYRDANTRARDFAATPEPQSPQYVKESATRDFANADDATPRALHTGSQYGKPVPISTHMIDRAMPKAESIRTESPSKDSVNWWSEDEDERTPAPAPLRTNRLSTFDPSRQPASPVRVRPVTDSHTDTDQLESDIVKSLTPKSSTIPDTADKDVATTSSVHDDTHREHARPTSAPFAAAALAISPSREYATVRDQDSSQPLSAFNGNSVKYHQTSVADSTQEPTRPLFEPEKQHSPTIAQTLQNQLGGIAATVASMIPGVPTTSRNHEPGQKETTARAATPDVGAHEPSLHASTSPATKNDVREFSGTNIDRDAYTSARDSYQPPVDRNRTPSDTLKSSDLAGSQSATLPREESRLPTRKDSTERAPMTPPKDPPRPITSVDETTSRSRSPSTRTSTPPSPITPRTPKQAMLPTQYNSNRPFPGDRVPVTQIAGMSTAQARIHAYNENRDAYVQPVGHLENWLTYMSNSGHADLFVVGPTSASPYAPDSAQRHARESSGTQGGTRQMQEDGKRLLASASKYGQKAGILGKGLFAKGKEKLRTASAGQKGLPTEQSRNVSTSTINQRPVAINQRSSMTDQIPAIVDEKSASTRSTAPQIPTPAMSTPIEESTLSKYFSTSNSDDVSRNLAPLNTTAGHPASRTAIRPVFSPVSEASTNQTETNLKRTVSPVGEQHEQSPQSADTARPRTFPTSTARQMETPTRKDTIKSAGGVSAMDTDDGYISTDLYHPRDARDLRRDSSVSDVSAVSNELDRTQTQTDRAVTAGISPDLQPQITRDDPKYTPSHVQAPASASLPPADLQQNHQHSGHAPSYSSAMATAPMPQPQSAKEAEAQADRQEESSLPRYSQIPAPPPRIPQGAQIVPIARIRQDQEPPRAETSRPFSFAGSESILNAGHGTNGSIDHVTSNDVHSSGSAERNLLAQISGPHQTQALRDQYAGSPLPSARRNPEEFAGRTPEEFAKLRQPQPQVQTQPQEEGGYRIPGPYGQELRSPRQKTSSPLLEQLRRTPVEQQQPEERNGPSHTSAIPTESVVYRFDHAQRHYPQDNEADARLRQEASFSQQQQAPFGSPIGEQLERVHTRNRPSRLTSFFRNRSKSRSRAQKDDRRAQPSEDMPSTSRRPSLLNFGSRGSMSGSREKSAQRLDSREPMIESNARPGQGGRKISKDLFKSTTFGQAQHEQVTPSEQYAQPERTSAGKKKRFSGFFGKPSARDEQPQRASTLPTNSQQPQFQQSTAHDRQDYPGQSEAETMHHGSRQGQRPNDNQQDPRKSFQGMAPPREGYYGGQANTLRQQALSPSHDRNHTGLDDPDAPLQGTWPYQYGNLHDRYDGRSRNEDYHSPQQRPDLPRLNTGDHSYQGKQQPLSAPAGPTHDQVPQRSLATTSYPNRQQQQQQYSHRIPEQAREAYQPPSTRVNKDISHGSDTIHRASSPSQAHNQSWERGPQNEPKSYSNAHPHKFQTDAVSRIAAENRAVQPQSNISPRVKQLHTRSRSPKRGRTSSEDMNAEFQNFPPHSASPVLGLGTFNSKKVSPIGVTRSEADQEKPWAITLPEDEQQKQGVEDPSSATSARAREMRRVMLERTPQQPQQTAPAETRPQTVADRFMNHGQSSQQPKTIIASPTANSDSGTNASSGAVLAPRAQSPSVTINKNSSLRGRGPINRTITPTDFENCHREAGHESSIYTNKRPSTDVSVASLSREPSRGQYGRHQPALAPPSLPPPAPLVSPPPMPKAVKSALPTSTNGATTHKMSPRNTRDHDAEVYELSGSKPEGYESEDEPMMSATAYPGQEWQPVFDRWED